PIARDDQEVTPFDTPVDVVIGLNDEAGAASAPLVPAATVFPADGQPEGAVVSPDGTTLEIPGEGTYVSHGDGRVTFTPVAGYVGDTTPVTYRIVDSNGTTDTATITVTVRP